MSDGQAKWITRRTHLQISRSHVIPVVFKTKSLVRFSDVLPVLKSWLAEHMNRVHAVQHANLKPGSLQTPHVLRSKTIGSDVQVTVWLQPSEGKFVVFDLNQGIVKQDEAGSCDVFQPTAQTLHVIAENEGTT